RPSVACRNLASRLLSLSLERLVEDFARRYHYRPWLVESFVDASRFSGACYRAANWMRVGATKGRGRQDRFTKREKTIKDIYVYPLEEHFRDRLGLPEGGGWGPLGPGDGLDGENWAKQEFGGAPLGDTEQLSEQQELLIPAKYRVIPCGINFVAVEPQLLYLFRGGLNPGLVPLGIQHRFHSQPGAGSCRANQVDHRFQVPERLPFPGQTDKREDPMLDPVPLTRTRRIVRHGDGDSDLLHQLHQIRFPSVGPTPIFKGSHKLFFLRVHRDHRISAGSKGSLLTIDISKLCVPVGMLRPFFLFPIQLQRVAHLVQHPRNRFIAHRMSPPGQLRSKRFRGFVGPAHGAHRISRCGFFHHLREFRSQLLVCFFHFFPPGPSRPDSSGGPGFQLFSTAQLGYGFGEGRAGRPGQLRHSADSPSSLIQCQTRQKQPRLKLIQSAKHLQPTPFLWRPRLGPNHPSYADPIPSVCPANSSASPKLRFPI